MSYLNTYAKFMEQYEAPAQSYTREELESLIEDLICNIIDNPAAKISKEDAMKKLKSYINMLNNTPENLENLAYLAQGEDEETIAESKKKAKKDACYRKAKAKYDVFPSAYASGYISRCRKRKGKIK